MNIGWLSNEPFDKKQQWEKKTLYLSWIKLLIFSLSLPLIIGFLILILVSPNNPWALLRMIGIIEIVMIVGVVANVIFSMILLSEKKRIREISFDLYHAKFKLNNKRILIVKYEEIMTVGPYYLGGFFSMKQDPTNEAFRIRFIPNQKKEYPDGIINRQIAKMMIDKLRELKILP